MPKLKNIHAYISVSIAYCTFMLTDGALRMVLLLHFHTLAFTPVQLAYLFLLYEFSGMVSNLYAGWIGTKFGTARTLFLGMILQVVALLILAQLNPNWSVVLSVGFIMVLQGMSGVAKDLTKNSSKSTIKFITTNNQEGLFKWTARLTGSKNAVKGIGYLLGAFLLGIVGFQTALLLMAVVLAITTLGVIIFTIPDLPTGDVKTKLREVFSKSRNIKRLSLARLFLFGARDVWFVVGVPIYFFEVLSDGTIEGDQIACLIVGLFTGFWIVGYGVIQSISPHFFKYERLSILALISHTKKYVLYLFIVLFILGNLVYFTNMPSSWLTLSLTLGLIIFGIVFAINSAIHSYLILAFSDSSRVSLDVGFYYMANASGRLLGTFLSGLSFQLGGITLCLFTAGLMALISWVVTLWLSPSGLDIDNRI